MRLSTKIAAGFLFLVAVSVAAGIQQLSVIQRLHQANHRLSEISFEVGHLGVRMQYTVELLSTLTEKLQVLRDREYANELTAIRSRVGRSLVRLQALDLTDSERREVDRFSVLWRAYLEVGPRYEEEILEAGERATPAPRPEPEEHFDRLRSQLSQIVRASQAAMANRLAAGKASADRSRRLAWRAAIVGTVSALLIAFMIVRSVASPMRQLTRGTRELARGDFSYRVPASGGPEFVTLAESFNTMAGRLKELDQLKKDFVSNVSHDLKAPLASMQETTRLLLEGIPGPLKENQTHLLRLNLQCGERLSVMIENLLRLARVEAGAQEYEFERHDLIELTRLVLDDLENLIHEKGLKVVSDFPPSPVQVECDRSFLLQVLGNLLSNAVKFTDRGTAIGVRIEALAHEPHILPGPQGEVSGSDGFGALVEIWDSGPGVQDDHKQAIFERFYRVDAAKDGGTGLGLAIARKIIEGHGGTLWVEDHAGGGSAFRLWLRSSVPAVNREPIEQHRGLSEVVSRPEQA